MKDKELPQNEKLIQEWAEALQKECHDLTDELRKRNPTLTTQDCTNIWLYRKLAEIFLILNTLSDGKATTEPR